MVNIGYRLKFKKVGGYQSLGKFSEDEAEKFYENIPEYFKKLTEERNGLTGAIFCIGGKRYAYGSCMGTKGYVNVVPYTSVEKKKGKISDFSTEELIMELINRGYAISKA